MRLVTFTPGGSTMQNFTVDIINDDKLEGTESFFLDLSSSLSNVITGQRETAIIRIIDEDSKFQFVSYKLESDL